MTATDTLREVLSGDFNLRFKKAEIIKNGILLDTINDTIYLNQGGIIGDVKVILNYRYAIEVFQKYGIRVNFDCGHYDFFPHWEIQNENPLILFHFENDKINYIKLIAIDNPYSRDVTMEKAIQNDIVRCFGCMTY